MLKKICRECDTEMTKKYPPEGVTIYCESCEEATPFDEHEMEPYCPECEKKIIICKSCCEGYFCNTCNSIKSSKKIIWKKV